MSREAFQSWLNRCPLTLFGSEFQVAELAWQACEAHMQAEIVKRDAIIARKDEALKFYANSENHNDQVCCGQGNWSGNPFEPPECCGLPVNSIALDSGKIASDALALTPENYKVKDGE